MKRDPGFTLVEVLVALVAGGLLLALLSWLVGGLVRELHAHDRNVTLHQIEDAAPMLSDLIERAVPPRADGSGLVTKPDFLSMDVPPPQALSPVGLLRMDLTIEPRDGAKALVARFTADDPEVKLPPSALAPQVLVTGLRDVHFLYQARYHATPRMLPLLVTIVFTDGEGRIYPMVAGPRINVDPSCQIDPVTLACRP